MKFHFSKRERMISYISVAIVAAGGFYRLGYEAFWMRWKGLENRAIAAQRIIEQKFTILKQYAMDEAGRQQYLDVYRQKESDERIRSRVLLYLQDLSAKNNVRIVDMKPVQIRQDQMIKEFPVNMTLEGEFVEMMRFFYDIETVEEGFQIQEFRFTQAHAARKSLRCQVVITRIFLNLG